MVFRWLCQRYDKGSILENISVVSGRNLGGDLKIYDARGWLVLDLPIGLIQHRIADAIDSRLGRNSFRGCGLIRIFNLWSNRRCRCCQP